MSLGVNEGFQLAKELVWKSSTLEKVGGRGSKYIFQFFDFNLMEIQPVKHEFLSVFIFTRKKYFWLLWEWETISTLLCYLALTLATFSESVLSLSRVLSYSNIVHSWFIWKNLQINWKYWLFIKLINNPILELFNVLFLYLYKYFLLNQVTGFPYNKNINQNWKVSPWI